MILLSKIGIREGVVDGDGRGIGGSWKGVLYSMIRAACADMHHALCVLLYESSNVLLCVQHCTVQCCATLRSV